MAAKKKKKSTKKKTGKVVIGITVPSVVVLAVVVIVMALGRGGSGTSGGTTNPSSTPTPSSGIQTDNVLDFKYTPMATDALSVSYLEMTSSQYGDSILIKYGNFEILVDGGQPADATNVDKAISEYVTDGILDLLVVTHPHGDHYGSFLDYSAFRSASSVNAISYLVDFGCSYTTSQYSKYVSFRNSWIANGTTYYPIYQMIHNETTKYPNIFKITDDIKIDFLNTNSYVDVGQVVDDPNECSVSFVMSAGNYRYFLCGDADVEAEEGMVANYSSTDLWSEDTVNIVKGNHHASSSSNIATFLNMIKPDYEIISCSIVSENRTISGIVKAQHPYEAAIIRMQRYTDKIYWNGINGTIHVNSDADFSNINLAFDGRTVDYYTTTGLKVEAETERTTPYPDSNFHSQMERL